MPLYLTNARANCIEEAAKPLIAEDVTRIHCDVTNAPPSFVHAFFLDNALHPPLGDNSVIMTGTIRGGRSMEQRDAIAERMRHSIHARTNIPLDEIEVRIAETPASWVMEGGDLLPEPGDEDEWLMAHDLKRNAG